MLRHRCDRRGPPTIRYVLRSQALEEAFARAAPPFGPRLEKVEGSLADVGHV